MTDRGSVVYSPRPPELPVCPTCGNTLCMQYGDIFARNHLVGEDLEYYRNLKYQLDTFLHQRMADYREALINSLTEPVRALDKRVGHTPG